VPGGLEKRLLDNSLISIIFFYDNFMIGTHGGEDGADISADRLYFGMTPAPGTCLEDSRRKSWKISRMGMGSLAGCRKTRAAQAAQKRPDARHPKSRGMRRTFQYVAVTRDEGNAADGRFSAAC
jgi:hypothetical protein